MPTQESYDKMNLTEKKSAGNGELGNFLKKKNTALRGINNQHPVFIQDGGTSVLFVLRFS